MSRHLTSFREGPIEKSSTLNILSKIWQNLGLRRIFGKKSSTLEKTFCHYGQKSSTLEKTFCHYALTTRVFKFLPFCFQIHGLGEWELLPSKFWEDPTTFQIWIFLSKSKFSTKVLDMMGKVI